MLYLCAELENKIQLLEQQQQQSTNLRKDILNLEGETAHKIKELEKLIRLLKQEKDEVMRVSIRDVFIVHSFCSRFIDISCMYLKKMIDVSYLYCETLIT